MDVPVNRAIGPDLMPDLGARALAISVRISVHCPYSSAGLWTPALIRVGTEAPMEVLGLGDPRPPNPRRNTSNGAVEEKGVEIKRKLVSALFPLRFRSVSACSG
jgi:hypothetical protein